MVRPIFKQRVSKTGEPPRKYLLMKRMVGTGRFGLPTPRTPREGSTRLSHVPTRRENFAAAKPGQNYSNIPIATAAISPEAPGLPVVHCVRAAALPNRAARRMAMLFGC